jgi:hypothetical protein
VDRRHATRGHGRKASVAIADHSNCPSQSGDAGHMPCRAARRDTASPMNFSLAAARGRSRRARTLQVRANELQPTRAEAGSIPERDKPCFVAHRNMRSLGTCSNRRLSDSRHQLNPTGSRHGLRPQIPSWVTKWLRCHRCQMGACVDQHQKPRTLGYSLGPSSTSTGKDSPLL